MDSEFPTEIRASISVVWHRHVKSSILESDLCAPFYFRILLCACYLLVLFTVFFYMDHYKKKVICLCLSWR